MRRLVFLLALLVAFALGFCGGRLTAKPADEVDAPVMRSDWQSWWYSLTH